MRGLGTGHETASGHAVTCRRTGTDVAASVTMRIAIPIWNGHVSPVFDVAHEVAVFDIDRDRRAASAGTTHPLPTGRPAAGLEALGIDLLICSAISPALEAVLWVSGIEVIADVCGSPPGIATSFARGDTSLDDFRTPGSVRPRPPAAELSPDTDRGSDRGRAPSVRRERP
jgi:predicted Fe-Mo cluster-binding NifX family protein